MNESNKLCKRLLEEKNVATILGTAFERPPRELTLRIAYVNFDGVKAMAASETLPLDQELPQDFIKRRCEKAITAVGTSRSGYHKSIMVRHAKES